MVAFSSEWPSSFAVRVAVTTYRARASIHVMGTRRGGGEEAGGGGGGAVTARHAV